MDPGFGRDDGCTASTEAASTRSHSGKRKRQTVLPSHSEISSLREVAESLQHARQPGERRFAGRDLFRLVDGWQRRHRLAALDLDDDAVAEAGELRVVDGGLRHKTDDVTR
jgi:hypothetical protein